MRRVNHGDQSESNPYLQAGLATGYLCRRTEEELQRIGAATSGVVSARELGEWMGKFFLSQSAQDPRRFHDPKSLPEMRRDSAQGYALGPGEEAVHVRPRHQRTLSAHARAAISAAQRKRWKLQKRAERKRGRGKRSSWSGMTKAERSLEMKHRWDVRLAKSGKTRVSRMARGEQKMPRGFWQHEVEKLLRKGPLTQQELHGRLAKRYPEKHAALFVQLSTLKHKKQIVPVGDKFTLPASSANGGVEVA